MEWTSARPSPPNYQGGVRGFGDAMALETFSNDITPTIKCLQSFTLLVEVDEENNIL
jgi:hypothetical protein